MTAQKRTRMTLRALMVLSLLRIPTSLLIQALLPDVSQAPEANYLAALLQSLLMFALPGMLLMPAWHKGRDEGGMQPGFLLMALLAVVLTRSVASPLNHWWAGLLGVTGTMLPAPQNLLSLVLMLLAVAIGPAVAEEIFFRGALLTNLLRSGSRMQALVLTTLMFALMHGSLPGLPGHLLISLVLTLLMMHTGRLLVPILGHSVYNLLALRRVDMPVEAVAGCALALLGVLAWLLLRLPRGQERCLTRWEGVICAGVLAMMAAQYFM